MGQRKQRTDKKREVKPYLHVNLKDMIYRLSYITHTPVKDICEFMCVHVMSNRKAIDMLSTQFKRDIRLDNTLYRGLPDNVSAKKRVDSPSERVTVRFNQADYEVISILSYALDYSASRVVAILLEMALQDIQIVNMYIKKYLHEQLTPVQMKELRNLLKHLNSESDENSSWATLMSVVIDEVIAPVIRLKEVVGEFLINIRKYDDE